MTKNDNKAFTSSNENLSTDIEIVVEEQMELYFKSIEIPKI